LRRNFDLSTALVAIGAIAVLVSLFLEWYSPGLKAWDVFEIVDWALLALAVAALVVAGAEASGASAPTARLGWICGIVALLVIAQILDPPPAARDASREIGAWLALGGSAVMVIGAVLALAQISVTIDVSERERRRRTAAVDARAGDESRGAGPEDETQKSGRSGLWGKGGRRSGSAAAESSRREPVVTPPPAREQDPDRTQPLSPADRPREE
jgi:hypothetical protein